MKRRVACSLVFLLDTHRRRLLLGLKKTGFGAGNYNGYGGKIEKGETMINCAIRELEEESGIKLSAEDLRSRGRLDFDMVEDKLDIEVHIYSYALEINERIEAVETDEMRPKWFPFDKIPYDAMWLDDKYWLPLVIGGHDVNGTFKFLDHDTLLDYHIEASDGTVLDFSD